LLSSIAPALVAMRSDPQTVLQEASRGSSAGPKRSRLSATMVAGEVALSVVLLVAGGLMFRTLYKLQHLYLGFDASSLTKFIAIPGSAGGFFNPGKAPSDQSDSLALRIYQPMAEKLRHLPGVVDAAFSNAMPFETIDMNTGFQITGRPDLEKSNARLRALSGSYARVMRTPALHGRAINEQDTANAPKAVTVNETFAKRVFPGQNAVGQQVIIGGKNTDLKQPYTIVGVMADSVQDNVSQPAVPEIDLPYPQIPVTSFFYQVLVAPEANYVIRTQGPVEIVSSIRNAFHESHPDFALDEFITMTDARDQSDFSQRMGLYLIGSFAGIAVVMVLAGLYGVLSQFVGQRRREIGIRMALGADRASILSMILRRGLALIAVGLGIGLLASAATEQSLRSFLFGVSPLDPWTYVGVTAVLVAVGILAALIPARRAAGTEPTNALRAE
jgi:predicted permease